MDRDDDDDLSCCGSVEDEPPFAFFDAPASKMRALFKLVSPIDHTLLEDKLHSLKSPSESHETAKTAMGSSILYSPISRSQSQSNPGCSDQLPDEPISDDRSSDHLPDEFIDDDIEFDAAASLLADSPMLGRSSHFLVRSESDNHTAQPCPQESMGFSELMQEADDQHMHRTYKTPAMPTLLEDSEMDMRTEHRGSSVLTPRLSNHSMLGVFMNPNVSHSPRSPNLFSKRGIETRRLDQDTFEVSMSIYLDCSTQDVMDIVGNPDLLRLWCEPVRTLVVTRSSEGARSAANRNAPERGDREVSSVSLVGLRIAFGCVSDFYDWLTCAVSSTILAVRWGMDRGNNIILGQSLSTYQYSASDGPVHLVPLGFPLVRKNHYVC